MGRGFACFLGLGLGLGLCVCDDGEVFLVFFESVVDRGQGAEHAICPFRGWPYISHIFHLFCR